MQEEELAEEVALAEEMASVEAVAVIEEMAVRGRAVVGTGAAALRSRDAGLETAPCGGRSRFGQGGRMTYSDTECFLPCNANIGSK